MAVFFIAKGAKASPPLQNPCDWVSKIEEDFYD
jgi:hypothetical protein